MKKRARKFLSLLLVLAVSFTMICGSTGVVFAADYDKTKAAFERCGDYLYRTVTDPTVESISGEWVMYGLGHGGYAMSDAYIAKYRANLEKKLQENNGILHEKKFTEYGRVILACLAVGIDPTQVVGCNLVTALADFPNVKWLSLLSVSYALLALDYGGYDMPKRTDDYPYGMLTPKETDRQNSRQRMIDYILTNQFDDGGWNYAPKSALTSADVDATAMILICLGPYMKQAKVKKAVDRALDFLSEKQQDDGGYASWGTSNSESCAQVICGLLACGVNPNTDARFIKNGKSVIDGLMLFYDEQVGGFRHVNTASGGYKPVVNQMATEQAYYALAFYFKDVPTKAALSKAVKAGSGKIKLSWKKAAVNTDYVTKKSGKTAEVSGYQIVCATDKKFSKNVKRVTASGSKTLTKTVTNLKKGKTYYVKVRAYKTVNGKKLYGAYSAVKRVQC